MSPDTISQNEKSYSFYTTNLTPEVIENKSEKEYYVEGIISTGDKDLYNDIVSDSCLDDMVSQLKTKNIKIDYDHEAFRDDNTILPAGMVVDSKRVNKGVWVRTKLNPSSPKFKALWNSVKNGFVDAFSITYKVADKVNKMVGGVATRILNKVDLVNVALTGNPVNPACKIMDVFTKSLNDITLEEKNKMTEEETPAEAPVEEKVEETPTEEAAPVAEEPAKEEEAPAEAPAEAPEGAEEPEQKSLSKELKAEIKSLRDEMSGLKEELSKPQFKAIQEEPKTIPEEKAISPLGRIN